MSSPSITYSFCLGMLLFASPALARTWIDSTGAYKIEADFVGFDGTTVELKKADGSISRLPIGRLSQRDQVWVRAEMKRQTMPTDEPAASAAEALASTDWPGWRGPQRDGISREQGLLKEWPSGGPPLLWSSRGLGNGFSSLAIAGDKIYTMGKKGGQVQLVCASRDDGTVIWETPVGDGSDPNCTPTLDVEAGLVYGLSHAGDLLCASATDGAVVWRKNFPNDFGGRMMSMWGYSESPLIDGDRLICTPGSDRAVMAALDKKTGDVIWQTPMQEGTAGYASPVISHAGGIKQYVNLVGKGLIGIRAADGEPLWHYPRVANTTANVPTPLVDGNFVFCSSGYGDGGSALLELKKQGRTIRYREVYYKDNRTLQNHHGGMILIDGKIYMGHGHNQGFPRCVDLRSGRTVWGEGQRGPGKGSAAIVAADGHLIFRYEDGVVALIEANPGGYQLKGEFKPASVNGKAWAHPVIAGKRLYLRDQDELHCYDIGAGS
ncbi:outer membrane biogenesis protein BamB [Rosistilla carotiformis]|uniref:Outer membrane biogenesis protein BamB n=1 Tax=Rosistilla carotiformis TaxID=2528017 RepID=A0A518K113_9BACT|nr:PQQ-binding-like beta-propeller repeat protein [Rosistilla carotiformis]QDV71483.1 outer membrane biogenesis protein BamB [Rosistilla carotiformis]